MAIVITSTKVSSRFMGNVTATCPVCGELQRVNLFKREDSETSYEAWVYCERCKSSYVIEAKEVPDKEKSIREKRRNAAA